MEGKGMSRPRVFITRILPDQGLEQIHAISDAEVWPDEQPPSKDVLLEKVKNVDGLVCLLSDPIDAQVIETAGDELRVISQMAVGYDNIDLSTATRRGIPVGNTPGVLTDTTADFAFALIMAAGRRIVEGERYVKAGKWKTWGPTLLMGSDIYQATLGIIGFGRIGQALAKRAQGFSMRVLFYDPGFNEETELPLNAQSVDLDTLLRESDFISLHVPLNKKTRHMISAHELGMMKRSAVLVNTARGPVVDSQALFNALKHDHIAYAALDVTDPEPIHPDDPLLKLNNCLVLPHIASSSLATRTKMGIMAAENLKAGLSGERLPYCVNEEVYDKPIK
jgi:glyoxylate reductase